MFKHEDFLKKIIYTSDGVKIPVGNIYCIGRNYKKHIEELHSIDLGEPVIFSKFDISVVQGDCKIPYPEISTNFHHEVEIALIIGYDKKKFSGKNIKPDDTNITKIIIHDRVCIYGCKDLAIYLSNTDFSIDRNITDDYEKIGDSRTNTFTFDPTKRASYLLIKSKFTKEPSKN